MQTCPQESLTITAISVVHLVQVTSRLQGTKTFYSGCWYVGENEKMIGIDGVYYLVYSKSMHLSCWFVVENDCKKIFPISLMILVGCNGIVTLFRKLVSL